MLHLYNTMTRTIERFVPRTRGEVRIFTCGPSIYRRPHIGNYRTFMFEDILCRYLAFMGLAVDRSIPLTDIEDKTIAEALKQGRAVEELTQDVAKIFIAESKELGIRLPNPVPRSSRHVDHAASIIAVLMKKGHAYRHGKDIFFDPLTVPGFGKLARVDTAAWPRKKLRFRRDTYPGSQWNKGDFILWHGYRAGDVSWWDTEIGPGRPSWNVQDPSIVVAALGCQIDINCGGIDNLVRHHDYNIAIMESYCGREYARFYLHGEHLVVEGRTMSKSKGNILHPEDIYARGHEPGHLRYFLLHTHYRKKLNYTVERFDAAACRLDDLRALARSLSRGTAGAPGSAARALMKEFTGAMDDDLAAGLAADRIHEQLRGLAARKAARTLEHGALSGLKDTLDRIDSVLGIL